MKLNFRLVKITKAVIITLVVGLILIVASKSWSGFFRQSAKNFQQQTNTFFSLSDHQLAEVKLGEKVISVEIVNSSKSISQGLSGRDEIGSDGMLFIMPKTQIPVFWMKGMKFDLDMVWLLMSVDALGQKNIQVVDINKNVAAPVPDTALKDLVRVSPEMPIDLVLEIEAGKADDWDIEVSDEMLILFF